MSYAGAICKPTIIIFVRKRSFGSIQNSKKKKHENFRIGLIGQ
jgi:hypothetical protein